MPNPTQKPLAELTVNDVTQAYDDAFDAPEPKKAKTPQQPVAPKAPAAGTSEPTVETTETPEVEKPQRRRRADGTFMPEHSPYWLRKAQEVGLGEDEVGSMEPDELRAAVQVEAQSRGQAVRDTNSVQPVKETPPPPKLSIEIKDEDYDPALAGVLKSIIARLDAAETREVARQQRGLVNALDRKFDAHKEIFGAGPTHKLAPDSPEYLKRQLLMQGMHMLAQAGQKTTVDDDFDRIAPAFGAVKKAAKAAKATEADDDEHLWNTPGGAARREPSEEPAKPRNRLTRDAEWAENGAQPPTHRNKPELPKGPAKAKATFVNGMGALEDKRIASGETDENEELPG